MSGDATKTFVVYSERETKLVCYTLGQGGLPFTCEENGEKSMHRPHWATFQVRDVSALKLKSVLKACNALYLAKDF